MTDLSLRVRLIARTEFLPPADVPWSTDASGGQALVEFAGRACYQSWNRPVPATATNAGFLAHLLQVGHLSLLEHASATFYITGVSRSVTHEMLRHRHLSISELSQRYEPDGGPVVSPPADIVADPALRVGFEAAAVVAASAYRELLDQLSADAADGAAGTMHRRRARQAARSILPHAESTAVVASGNFRAWRHFVGARATDAVDAEIRSLAVQILEQLSAIAPNAFADFRISQLPDGTRTAASPLVGEG